MDTNKETQTIKLINKEQEEDIKTYLSDKYNNEAIKVITLNVNCSLKQLLNDGNTEFKKKMGREMTYSEMRQMWG